MAQIYQIWIIQITPSRGVNSYICCASGNVWCHNFFLLISWCVNFLKRECFPQTANIPSLSFKPRVRKSCQGLFNLSFGGIFMIIQDWCSNFGRNKLFIDFTTVPPGSGHFQSDEEESTRKQWQKEEEKNKDKENTIQNTPIFFWPICN